MGWVGQHRSLSGNIDWTVIPKRGISSRPFIYVYFHFKAQEDFPCRPLFSTEDTSVRTRG